MANIGHAAIALATVPMMRRRDRMSLAKVLPNPCHHAPKSRARERPAHDPSSDSRNGLAVICWAANQGICARDTLMADSNSRIAWHRAQLKKNREALKSFEVARFAGSHDRRGETAR